VTDPVTDGDVLARLDYMTDHRHVATIANWHQLARDAAAEVRALRDQRDTATGVLADMTRRLVEATYGEEADRDLIGRAHAALDAAVDRPPTGTPDTTDDALLDRAEQQMRDWERGRSIDIRAVIDLIGDLYTEVRALRDQRDEAQLRSIEARNPGIDMDEVRRLRAAGRPPTGTPDTAGDDT
jgi:hypothetical protein